MTDMQLVAEPGVPSVVISSAFDAPGDLVYHAHIEPELLVHWLGPHRLTQIIDHQEGRDGGRWRFVHRDADGDEFGLHGVFHGESSPELTVRTFEYEGAPGRVSPETLTQEDRCGRTLARTVSVYQSVEDPDAVVQSGMENGVREGTKRLEELLARLSAAG